MKQSVFWFFPDLILKNEVKLIFRSEGLGASSYWEVPLSVLMKAANVLGSQRIAFIPLLSGLVR